jgi:hypothetical protein
MGVCDEGFELETEIINKEYEDLLQDVFLESCADLENTEVGIATNYSFTDLLRPGYEQTEDEDRVSQAIRHIRTKTENLDDLSENATLKTVVYTNATMRNFVENQHDNAHYNTADTFVQLCMYAGCSFDKRVTQALLCTENTVFRYTINPEIDWSNSPPLVVNFLAFPEREFFYYSGRRPDHATFLRKQLQANSTPLKFLPQNC